VSRVTVPASTKSGGKLIDRLCPNLLRTVNSLRGAVDRFGRGSNKCALNSAPQPILVVLPFAVIRKMKGGKV
jgi:hypothetical protein